MSTTSNPAIPPLEALQQAAAAGKISATAVENIRAWLTEPRYAEYAPQVAEQIAAGHWQQLDDVFWTVIPFGTGSSLEGQVNAPFGGISIDFSNMKRVLEVNAEDLDCTVEPGITREELNAVIAALLN